MRRIHALDLLWFALRLCITAVYLGWIYLQTPQLILNCGETDGKNKYSEKDIRIFPEIVPLL